MKRMAVAVCMVVLIFAATSIAQPPARPKSVSAEQELIKLEKEYSEAYVKHDLAALERLESDGIILTDSDGSVFAKREDIEEVKAGVLVVTSLVQDDMKVTVFGEAAVVTYRSTEKGQYRGKDYIGRFRYTDTWVKKAGRWQVVASHWSRIAGLIKREFS
jgi:ketosteroid isomerase-like protein